MSDLSLRWEYLLAIVVIITSGVCVAIGKIDSKDFIAIIGMVLAFLGGTFYGVRKSERETKKATSQIR